MDVRGGNSSLKYRRHGKKAFASPVKLDPDNASFVTWPCCDENELRPIGVRFGNEGLV